MMKDGEQNEDGSQTYTDAVWEVLCGNVAGVVATLSRDLHLETRCCVNASGTAYTLRS